MERSGTEILNPQGWRDEDETITRIWDLEKNSDENFATTLGQKSEKCFSHKDSFDKVPLTAEVFSIFHPIKIPNLICSLKGFTKSY